MPNLTGDIDQLYWGYYYSITMEALADLTENQQIVLFMIDHMAKGRANFTAPMARDGWGIRALTFARACTKLKKLGLIKVEEQKLKKPRGEKITSKQRRTPTPLGRQLAAAIGVSLKDRLGIDSL